MLRRPPRSTLTDTLFPYPTLFRSYRYDYFIANCATRVRDALDRASGGAIARASKGVSSGRTYRFEATRLIGPVFPFALAMDAVMGPAGDAPIDLRSDMRRVGKGCGTTGRSWLSPYPYTKKHKKKH